MPPASGSPRSNAPSVKRTPMTFPSRRVSRSGPSGTGGAGAAPLASGELGGTSASRSPAARLGRPLSREPRGAAPRRARPRPRCRRSAPRRRPGAARAASERATSGFGVPCEGRAARGERRGPVAAAPPPAAALQRSPGRTSTCRAAPSAPRGPASAASSGHGRTTGAGARPRGASSASGRLAAARRAGAGTGARGRRRGGRLGDRVGAGVDERDVAGQAAGRSRAASPRRCASTGPASGRARAGGRPAEHRRARWSSRSPTVDVDRARRPRRPARRPDRQRGRAPAAGEPIVALPGAAGPSWPAPATTSVPSPAAPRAAWGLR